MRPGENAKSDVATDENYGGVQPRGGESEESKRRTRTRPSVSFVLLTVAIVIAGAGAIVWAVARPEPRTVEILIPTPGPMVVQVTGEVANPGLYTLQPGSRVADAITAAGGLSEPSNINLAAPLRDGQQIVVTAAGSIPSTGDLPTSEPPAPNILLDLNTASAIQMESLPNIGPTRAAAIISFRERNGPILFVDDLSTIDGIGPATVEALRPLVVQP